ncbi:MAG: FixH family protein [Acidobacteriota bacterium]
MKIRAYKISLGAAVAVCVALAAAVGYLLLHRNFAAPAPAAANDAVLASGPAVKPGMAMKMPAASDPQLAPVQISPQRLQEIGVTTATAEIRNVRHELDVPGNVDIDEEKLAYVQTRFPGWIQQVFANATYQYVRKGQALFTIYSPDLVSNEQEYLLARQNEKAFATGGNGMAGQESGWLTQAAEQRLQQFGVAPQEIAALEKTGKVERNVTVYSPVSGFITERNALPNAYVQPQTKVYTIADLSTVWVYANVFQEDVGRLRQGDAATVTVDAYPGRTFYGRIDQVLPQVDATTRTVRVRLVFANRGLVLKPGMFVNVKIAEELGRQLVVPASAVLQSGQRAVAFIDHGQGNLEPRVVTTGPQIDDSIVILSGLKAGDRVVTSANFLIDSEAQLQSAMQNFAPPAAQPAPKQAAEANVAIAFSTSPATPRKGSNTIRVQLTAGDGKPVTGAQVEVTFFMAAMPAMGMAAEHASAVLTDQGNGTYRAPIQLPAGGTYQVTVTVRRGGQTIASQQLSADATGGM